MSLAELGTSPGKVETIEQVGHYIDNPLAAFAHLCGNKSNALLLESAEIDSKDDLQSLLMVDAALRMECRGNRVEVKALNQHTISGYRGVNIPGVILKLPFISAHDKKNIL